MDTDCAARIGGAAAAAAAVACGMWRVPFVEIALNPAKRCRKYNYGRLDHNTIFPSLSLSLCFALASKESKSMGPKL